MISFGFWFVFVSFLLLGLIFVFRFKYIVESKR